MGFFDKGIISKDALAGGFMTTMIKDIIRGILNRSLKETTPKQLVSGIENGDSLWGCAGGDIMGYASGLPPMVSNGIAEARAIVESQYGGFDVLVLSWLKEDQSNLL